MDKFVIRKRKVVEKEAEANTTTHTTSAFPCPCPDNDRERSNLNEEDTESVVLVTSTEKESAPASTAVTGTKKYRWSFQPAWQKNWPWLCYDKDKCSVTCHVCSKASTANLLPVSLCRLVKGSTFVEEGFSNWKNAREKFKLHESSGLRSESLRVLSTEQTQPINAVLSDVASKQQNLARTVLELLFTVDQ